MFSIQLLDGLLSVNAVQSLTPGIVSTDAVYIFLYFGFSDSVYHALKNQNPDHDSSLNCHLSKVNSDLCSTGAKLRDCC